MKTKHMRKKSVSQAKKLKIPYNSNNISSFFFFFSRNINTLRYKSKYSHSSKGGSSARGADRTNLHEFRYLLMLFETNRFETNRATLSAARVRRAFCCLTHCFPVSVSFSFRYSVFWMSCALLRQRLASTRPTTQQCSRCRCVNCGKRLSLLR